ncbi:MAG: SoxR reducing system RseC family protein [Gammaproteobacteria bacterium]|nr:SoxR reducing system RseC family protein [Gammaproteobacteria bacterium]
MIEEKAIVTAVEGEYAWVEHQRQTACGSCSASTGCGTQALSKIWGDKRNRVRVLNNIGARVGEEIVLGLEEGALVKGSLALYFVPLLGLFLGAAAGGGICSILRIEFTDAIQIVFGLIGLVLGLAWARRFSRSIENDSRYQAVALRRVAPEVRFVSAIPSEPSCHK